MGREYSFRGILFEDKMENAKTSAIIASIMPKVRDKMDAAAAAWKLEHDLLQRIEADPRMRDLKIGGLEGAKGYSRPEGPVYDKRLEALKKLNPELAKQYDAARTSALEATNNLRKAVNISLSGSDLPNTSDEKASKEVVRLNIEKQAFEHGKKDAQSHQPGKCDKDLSEGTIAVATLPSLPQTRSR